jgi:2-keto-4-pentenoate hydratase
MTGSTLTHDDAHRAAALLWQHWQAGSRIDALPEDCRPRSRSDGYAVQREVLACAGEGLFGWKVAATSRAGQAHIGVDGPLAGRLFAGRAFRHGARVPIGTSLMRVAEPEFAFALGRDLAPRATRYTVDEVLDAVASLHPSIEVPDSRYRDFARVGAPQLIADNACANYFVLGPAAAAGWRALDLVRHRVTCDVSGRYAREGQGANVLGDPRVALTWLVNELSGLGITAQAGLVVTTGTCMVPLEVEPGDRVRADFGVLGTVEARFGD